MKLNIAINALAASVSTFAASASASGAVAKDPRDDHAEEGSIRAVAFKNQGSECYFAVGIEVQNSPDVGVLSCKVGETCIEDSMSSIGGRCVVSGNEVFLGYDFDPLGEFDPDGYAEWYGTFKGCESCGEDGSGRKMFKCCGSQACYGAYNDEDYISCGSCIGQLACFKPDWQKIGKGSCIGSGSCQHAQVDIGSGSCKQRGACNYVNGEDIGDNECNNHARECDGSDRPGLISVKN